MTEPWGVEQVVALAADPAQATAGRKLATPAVWSLTGHSSGQGTTHSAGDGVKPSTGPAALWGLCQGSGKDPYRTVVDLSGPAFNCSCPSRKFPCKHAIGLMLLWATGMVADREAPAGFAQEWLTARVAKAAKAAAGGASAGGETEPGGRAGVDGGGEAEPSAVDHAGEVGKAELAAAKRVAQRRERVTAGLDELDQWLCDQIRAGVSGLERSGYGQIETIAARMVDAQAPGVAGRLRRLPAVLASGEGWHSRLLEQFALLRLLVRAHRRLAELPEPMVDVVRAHVGYPMARERVLTGPAVRDTWAVLGLRDEIEDRLATRRIWLRGADTGRPALVLSFAPPGQQLDSSLAPGTALDADLHFYPGRIRALVGTRHGDPGLLPRLNPVVIGVALAEYAAALAADPWTASWPLLLDDVVPIKQDGRWLVRSDDGSALPLVRSVGDPWTLLAVSGGEPITLAGEWAADGFIPLSVVRRQELVRL